ncbi:DUF202 domain-containing protein [Rhodococcus antarcticus]|uniref:DUF202 domain-containing protein n=1 Tax=Rhodococcus antarcticus TaxID=2987751 RepID=A0ABY6NVJ2_9NOCA|nr:DUF202 domain-containing protein [Rhodococcus antarcticus]UZJ23410.1 DUF202 domain-containing protein [Rhodococcus antarcticus]
MAEPPPTLPAERTALAWSRTSLALLGNGALVLLRHLHVDGRPVEVVLAALAVALAVAVALVGRHRNRLLLRGDTPTVSRALLPMGWLIAGFCVFATVALVL